MLIHYTLIIKPVSSSCNLDCSYCYYSQPVTALWSGNRIVMSDTVLETLISKAFLSSPSMDVVFVWHGGEPLLAGIDFFRKIVTFQKKYQGQHRVFNSIQTNGLLINVTWCEFFKVNDFLVGVSLDGPERLNDEYRKRKDGFASFKTILKGIKLLTNYKVNFNTLTTVNKTNSHFPDKVFDALIDAGSTNIQFIPIVQPGMNQINHNLPAVNPKKNERTEQFLWAVDADAYGNFLIRIFNRWVHHYVGKLFVSNFESLLANYLGYISIICTESSRCGTGIVVECNGDVFSCDHYVIPVNKLGNILDYSFHDMVNSQEHQRFSNKKAEMLTGDCLSCEYLKLCFGGCPKDRFVSLNGSENLQNYLCLGLKRFYSYAIPYIRFMANELENHRSPANIMLAIKNGFITSKIDAYLT